jgi:Kef-type K+ transport system membrane component KefB
LTLGVLLNTRGLVELIVLNAGYELNLISAKLFTVLVVMALATTLMTYPLLQGLKRKESVTAGCD